MTDFLSSQNYDCDFLWIVTYLGINYPIVLHE